MKVVIYMAISSDGFIAKEDGSTDFVSDAEWINYSKFVNDAGNIIIGRKTYEIMKKNKEFDKFGDIFVVVVSSQDIKTTEKNYLFVKSSKEALEFLEKKNFNVAVVSGGGKLNTSFIKEDLVNEIILDVEPEILGKGIKLFDNIEPKLKLINKKKFGNNEFQCRYKVLKD